MANKKLGVELMEPTQKIWDLFVPEEGFNAVYYGKVRNGKTRTATADILELLKRGEIVYANWHIEFPDYDERDSFWTVFYKFFSGRRYFFKYDKDNFHFVDPDELISGDGEINIEYLNRLVGVHLFIDEGQWVLPALDRSYTPDAIAKMKLVLHGGHHCRSLNIITQRAGNISKTTRSQINIWYRCVKRFDTFGFMLFQRFAIEDMKDDLPVEFDEDKNPAGVVKNYFVNKKYDVVFKSYNTHAMRAKDAIEMRPSLEVYETTRMERLKMLLSFFRPSFKRKAKGGLSASPSRVLGKDEQSIKEADKRSSGADFEALKKVVESGEGILFPSKKKSNGIPT